MAADWHLVVRRRSLLWLAMLLLLPMSSREAGAASCPTYAAQQKVGEIDDSPPLLEISGFAASRQSPGVFWIHNDGGNPNHIYAIDEVGETLATYKLKDASNIDWEDIAIGPGPVDGEDYIYVGDIGNNSHGRSQIEAYRVVEPFVDPDKKPVTAGTNVITLSGVAKLPMGYPNGRFNSAALMVDPLSGDIIVVSKDIIDGHADIYINPAPHAAGVKKTLKYVTGIPTDDPVTAADISPAGDEILLRPKNFSRKIKVFLWPWGPNQSLKDALARSACLVPAALEPVGTAIGFAHDGGGYYTLSEGWHRPVYFYEKEGGGSSHAPVVDITAPSNGSSVQQGTSVTFTATANDPEDGNVRSSLEWTSNRDGWIGNGGSFTTSSLSSGSHSIVATAKDGQSNTGSDQIALFVGGSAVYYFSFNDSTSVPGVGTVRDEDIVSYTPSTDTWAMYFDGSDVGLAGTDVNAFHVRPDGSILISIESGGGYTVPGLQGGPSGTTVDDSDVILFTGSSGWSTNGSFSFYFDGSDVGLSSSSEDIDGLHEFADGSLGISTLGGVTANGASGSDEDVLRFTGSFGAQTSGSFERYFDGSDEGFGASNDYDLDAIAFDQDADLLFSTVGDYSAGGGSGADEDVSRFTGTFGSSTSGSATRELNLSQLGVGSGDVDGLSFQP